MNHRTLLLSLKAVLLSVLLTGCATEHTISLSYPDGKSAYFKLKQTADVVGDQEMKVKLPGGAVYSYSILTPRDASGAIAVKRTAVLNKARDTVIGYNEEPIVAMTSHSNPLRALGDSASKFIRAVGSLAGTVGSSLIGWETAKQGTAALNTAVQTH